LGETREGGVGGRMKKGGGVVDRGNTGPLLRMREKNEKGDWMVFIGYVTREGGGERGGREEGEGEVGGEGARTEVRGGMGETGRRGVREMSGERV